MKVLIVEDELRLAESLARGFMLKGHTADVVRDGKSALDRITAHADEYDILVLDLMLPFVTGSEVCEVVRGQGITIPILILTATEGVDSKVQLLHGGADDYMVKPFSFEELFARLEAILRRPKVCAPEVLSVGHLEMNTHERTVYADREKLDLTHKEYAILEYLMRRPQQAVTREELLSRLWDFNFDPFSNVLDVHVKNLRKKIAQENTPDFLETVRGVGYRLRP